MKKILVVVMLLLIPLSVSAQINVIEQVFSILGRDYISEMSNKDITLKGLNALHEMDSNIVVKQTSDKIFLYHKSKLIGKFNLPSHINDQNAYINLSQEVIKTATKFSEKLEVLDFEIPDRFAKSVFDGLDGYSHYFGAFDENDDKPFKIRRSFASRTIDDVLLIKILTFQKDISVRVKEAVLECSKCTSLILDLRANHGGFFDEAIRIADMFLDEGIITYTQSSESDTPMYYNAASGDILDGKPMVILVDGKTASAAEVLAASLAEQDRAILIGTKTYGKGSIQDVTKMDQDRAISVTTSFFYTPSGLKIDQKGLNPLICTGKNQSCEPADRFNKDEDIEEAVKFLKGD